MYDVNAGVVCIEKSRDEDIGRGLRWESRQDFSSRGWFLSTHEKGCARWPVFAVRRLVLLQLILVLLLVLDEVVLDFREL